MAVATNMSWQLSIERWHLFEACRTFSYVCKKSSPLNQASHTFFPYLTKSLLFAEKLFFHLVELQCWEYNQYLEYVISWTVFVMKQHLVSVQLSNLSSVLKNVIIGTYKHACSSVWHHRQTDKHKQALGHIIHIVPHSFLNCFAVVSLLHVYMWIC